MDHRSMSITPVHKCQCRGDEDAGPNGTFWCQFHQCRKTQHWKRLCETRPKHRDKWNAGRGMGQSAGGQSEIQPAVPPTGPGTELSRMLSWFGVHAQTNCKCKAHVRTMNVWGAAMCEQQIETIVGWLCVEAKQRGLPVVPRVFRLLVKQAIRRSRKKERVTA